MESDNWRTDEPEVGQPLTVYGESKRSLKIYRGRMNGYFLFEGQDGVDAEEDVPEWLPITTPEEARLRKRVSQLEDFRAKVLRAYMEEGSTNIYIEEVSKAVSELRAIEKQEGGWDDS